MEYEKSCGFVAYRQIEEKKEYLLIKSINGDVGFPKGHTEQGESEMETAIRELKEETNVTVEPVEGFRREISYSLPRKENTKKQVVYFLGKCVSERLTPQANEVKEAYFLPYEDAIKALTFEDTKKILKAAEAFLRSR